MRQRSRSQQRRRGAAGDAEAEMSEATQTKRASKKDLFTEISSTDTLDFVAEKKYSDQLKKV